MIHLRVSTAPNIKDFFEIFDELFETPSIINSNNTTSHRCPIHDVIENDKEFVVEMILAGLKKEDIDVDVDKDKLIIKTERKNKDLKYNHKETYFGKYEKSFALPDYVDKENINASYADGILTIIVPKIVNSKKDRAKIEVK